DGRQSSQGLAGTEPAAKIRPEPFADGDRGQRVPGALDPRQRRRVAVARLARVASDRRDQRPKVELRGVEEDKDVAGRRAGVDLANTESAREARRQTSGVRGPAAHALDLQPGAAAHRDEDDPDDGKPGRSL